MHVHTGLCMQNNISSLIYHIINHLCHMIIAEVHKCSCAAHDILPGPVLGVYPLALAVQGSYASWCAVSCSCGLCDPALLPEAAA